MSRVGGVVLRSTALGALLGILTLGGGGCGTVREWISGAETKGDPAESGAADAGTAGETTPVTDSAAASPTAEPVVFTPGEGCEMSPEERALYAELGERRAAIERRERAVATGEARLEELRAEVLALLEREGKGTTVLDEKAGATAESVAGDAAAFAPAERAVTGPSGPEGRPPIPGEHLAMLIEILASMRTAEAAAMLAVLPESLAARVLRRLPPLRVSKLLAAMETKNAAHLAELLVGPKKGPVE